MNRYTFLFVKYQTKPMQKEVIEATDYLAAADIFNIIHPGSTVYDIEFEYDV